MIPKEFIPTLKKLLTLRFDELPDYDGIIRAIRELQDKGSTGMTKKFEWTISLASKL
jgi:hypothetical protein